MRSGGHGGEAHAALGGYDLHREVEGIYGRGIGDVVRIDMPRSERKGAASGSRLEHFTRRLRRVQREPEPRTLDVAGAHLPSAYVEQDPQRYLASYAGTYLREEVMAEALTRNLNAFSRFLTAATFSQAAVLSIATVARDVGLPRKTVEGYFQLLEDLLLSIRLPVFTRRAKRPMTGHPKFYLFDAGVFRALRPKGPLDSPEEIDGPALETLVMQELRATNDNHELGYDLYYWRTRDQKEVDFVLYGERGLRAFEVKRSARFQERDLASLELFAADYPMARCFLLYGGTRSYQHGRIEVLPLSSALPKLPELLA